MRRLLAILASTLVIGIGVLTLLGLLVGDDLGFLSLLVDAFAIREIARLFIQLAVITVAITIVIGVGNLLLVHSTRLVARRRGWLFSLVLVVSLLASLVVSTLERVNPTPGVRPLSTIAFESVLVTVESSLAALVFFALVFGAYRLMRRRVSASHLLFTAALLVVLIGSLPIAGSGTSLLAQVRDWLISVPVSAGARGVLLGVALATLVAGIRILTGQDRSYRE